MEFAIRLFFILLGSIFKRCLLPFLVVTIILTIFVGVISGLSGGDLWLAVRYTLYACVGLGVLSAFIGAFAGMRS